MRTEPPLPPHSLELTNSSPTPPSPQHPDPSDRIRDRPLPMKAGDGEAPGGGEAEAPALLRLIDQHGGGRQAPPATALRSWRGQAVRPRGLREGLQQVWELLSHEVVHTAARPFLCGLCAAAFKSHSDCKSHRLVHSDGRPHRCHACGKRFKRASHLQEHQRLHTGERPFPCPSCPPEALQDPLRAARPGATARPFAALLLSGLRQGLRNGAGPASAPAATLRGQASCVRVCGKRFTSGHSLRVHGRVHTGDPVRPYACRFCPKLFKDLAYRAVHEKVHTGDTPYKCSICSKSFAHPSNLLQHQRVHRDA
ncbi:PREDICTED: zinc finger protein 629-like [Ceratotherium simum simum]|uniref:Zinc finger protein 629-like n=1 Tax=Ceratotherium simum simum TaxID=73337 RepID=A0ABM1DFI8_CERSS|nr:PREDICTED: zinc finger protein 629-like [Ceratotherium simum simum]